MFARMIRSFLVVLSVVILTATGSAGSEQSVPGQTEPGIAFVENSTDFDNPEAPDTFLVGHTISGGWMSEAVYEDGLLANEPGEAIAWLEYEAVSTSGLYAKFFLAASLDNRGLEASYATEIDGTAGYRHSWEHETSGWTTTLDASLMYFNFGTPSLKTTDEDVWGIGLEVEWASEEFGVAAYVAATKYFEVSGEGAGNGFVARAGIRGEWGSDTAGWAIDIALGRNFGWFETEMTYVYAYVGPYIMLSETLSLSIPEVTGVAQVSGNGESLLAVGFTFTKTWGRSE